MASHPCDSLLFSANYWKVNLRMRCSLWPLPLPLCSSPLHLSPSVSLSLLSFIPPSLFLFLSLLRERHQKLVSSCYPTCRVIPLIKANFLIFCTSLKIDCYFQLKRGRDIYQTSGIQAPSFIDSNQISGNRKSAIHRCYLLY